MEDEKNNDIKTIWETVEAGKTLVVDTRVVNEYARGHVPGSLLAPFSRYNWGKAVADYLADDSRHLAFVASNNAMATVVRKELEKNGLQAKFEISDGLNQWKQEELPVASVWEITPEELHEDLENFDIIDVREPYEWRSGIIPNAKKIPLQELVERIGELPKNRKYALVCATGARSQSAAIFMADSGFDAGNVVGGMSRWLSKGFTVSN